MLRVAPWVLACLSIGTSAFTALPLTAQTPAQTQPERHVFLLLGQSNMAGRGGVEAEDRQPHPRVQMLDAELQWQPAVDPMHFDKPKVVGVGPGRSFALDYAAAHPDVQVGLVPCAAGGSPIDAWQPGGYHAQTASHPYDDALLRAKAALKQGVLKGILWHQGESDSKGELATAYHDKLVALITRFRQELNAPHVPFVIGQLGQFPERPWDAARQQVDAAQRRIATEVPHVGFASSEGLQHNGDQVHFNSAAARELGHRYFAAFQRIVTDAASGADKPSSADSSPAQPRLLRVSRIWSEGQHNAFTDLIRFKEKWFCVFREGTAHVSPDGGLRVLTSEDGRQWRSAALITSEVADLRDAKLAITPAGQLMLSGAGAMHDTSEFNHQSLSWFSDDGVHWSDAHAIGERDNWLWRTVWQAGTAYGVGYATHDSPDRKVKLYHSPDGKQYTTLVENLFTEGYPNESGLIFLEDGTAYCLLRRDGGTKTGQWGTAKPPYTDWRWSDMQVRIGGPQMLRLPDGRIVAAVRLYDKKVRTALCWIEPKSGQLTEFLALPSGGDTSYAGLVWHDDHLWVSYYSAHERGDDFTTAIYIAEVAIP